MGRVHAGSKEITLKVFGKSLTRGPGVYERCRIKELGRLALGQKDLNGHALGCYLHRPKLTSALPCTTAVAHLKAGG